MDIAAVLHKLIDRAQLHTEAEAQEAHAAVDAHYGSPAEDAAPADAEGAAAQEVPSTGFPPPAGADGGADHE